MRVVRGHVGKDDGEGLETVGGRGIRANALRAVHGCTECVQAEPILIAETEILFKGDRVVVGIEFVNGVTESGGKGIPRAR